MIIDHGGSRIVQLRILGSERAFELPERGQCVIGSSSDCLVRVPAESGAAAHHARMVCNGSVWTIHAVGTSGLWLDGARVPCGVVTPGTEIRLGDVRLIAESSETIATRGLLAWLVGYGSRARLEIERMLRGIREVALGRTVLVLCGRGELSAIAARLHHTMVGTDAPFVTVARNLRVDAALAASRDGTLCISAQQLVSALDVIRARMRSPRWRTRLVICAPTIQAAAIALELGSVTMVSIAPLEDRRREFARIIEQCARDAAMELGQESTGLTRADRAWLRGGSYRALTDLGETVRRVVAIRALGVTHGATHLGLSHGALSRWARRRSIPTELANRGAWI